MATAQAQVQESGIKAMTPEHNYKLSDFLGDKMYSPAKIELIRRTVAKGCNDLELAYFLSIAKGVGLNPLVKEIWCYKDHKGNQIMFAGRDGFKRLVQKEKTFISLNSMEVREGDEFSIATVSGQITVNHNFTPASARFKKPILGAYAILRSKRADQVDEIIEWADWERYVKNFQNKTTVWQTHPEEMIKKVAEVHAMKKFTNISSIYTEEEFELRENKNGETIVHNYPDRIEAGNTRKEQLRDKFRHGKHKHRK